jgi:transaldolase
MPLGTIEAFGDHGQVRGDTVCEDYAGAHRVIERLRACGIEIDTVTQQLLEAGVKQFADSYDQLINGIAEKVDALHGRLTAQRR